MPDHPFTGHPDPDRPEQGRPDRGRRAGRDDDDVLAALRSAHALLLDEPDPAPDAPTWVPRSPGSGRRDLRPWLASARVFEVDVNGCPTAMPAVSAGGFDQITGATRVALCQYQLLNGAWVALASSRVEGVAASRIVHAIRTAPSGSGPDSVGASCATDEAGRIMVRFQTPSGVHTLALHFDGCASPNGYAAGDGTWHRLTRANCRDILVLPVNLRALMSGPAEVCTQ